VQRVHLAWAQAARGAQELNVGALQLGAKGRVHDDSVWPQPLALALLLLLLLLLCQQLRHVTLQEVNLRGRARRCDGCGALLCSQVGWDRCFCVCDSTVRTSQHGTRHTQQMQLRTGSGSSNCSQLRSATCSASASTSKPSSAGLPSSAAPIASMPCVRRT
jgi:hypothetical protein